jgi:hypothetical protein
MDDSLHPLLVHPRFDPVTLSVSSPRSTLCIISSRFSSFIVRVVIPHPDIITLPLTPDIITLLQQEQYLSLTGPPESR